MRIELFSRKRLLKRPLWYFRVVATNGQVVAQSEGYSRRLDAKETAEGLKAQLPRAPIVDFKENHHG
jgi:uncharacterized protein YegP (UPF0339 family)